MVLIPISRAPLSAARMLGERPDVEIARKTSPGGQAHEVDAQRVRSHSHWRRVTTDEFAVSDRGRGCDRNEAGRIRPRCGRLRFPVAGNQKLATGVERLRDRVGNRHRAACSASRRPAPACRAITKCQDEFVAAAHRSFAIATTVVVAVAEYCKRYRPGSTAPERPRDLVPQRLEQILQRCAVTSG